jgi:enoyl-CoA hydratase
MAVDAVGLRHARTLLLTGESLMPAQAAQTGLADELARPEAVLERALERARVLAEKPAGAFAAFKHSLREVAGHGRGESDRRGLEEFINHWFSPEAEERKRTLAARL